MGATRWVPPGEQVAPLGRVRRPADAPARRGGRRRGGLVLGAGAVAGRPGVVVTVVLAQVVLAPAWMLGTDRPGRIGGMLIGLGAAAAGDVALLVRDRTSPAVLLGVLGLALPAMIVHQLARGVVRVRVTESVAGGRRAGRGRGRRSACRSRWPGPRTGTGWSARWCWPPRPD